VVRIDVRYEGGLRTRAVHGPSGTELITDAPVDNRGQGRSFSPTDLLGTAVGTCILTLMGIAAQDRGFDLAGATASVEKHMVATPRRRIGRLVVDIAVPQDPGPEGRRVLEAAARGCPVSASLAPDVAVELTFRWGG
jgi:putative redox protein